MRKSFKPENVVESEKRVLKMTTEMFIKYCSSKCFINKKCKHFQVTNLDTCYLFGDAIETQYLLPAHDAAVGHCRYDIKNFKYQVFNGTQE